MARLYPANLPPANIPFENTTLATVTLVPTMVLSSLNGNNFAFNFTATGPSPFNTTSLTYGTYNPNHTTNATLVYTPETVPTPWLVLIFGYLHCIYTLLSGIWSMVNPKRRSSLKKFNTLTNTVYICYRFVAAFRKSIQSMHNPAVPTGDLFQLDFMIATAAVHSTKQIFDNHPVINWLINVVVWALSILLYVPSTQSALRVVQRQQPYYSKWDLVGGNCPLAVGSCQQLKYFGCGQETLPNGLGLGVRDPNIIDTANYLRIFQFIGGIQTFIVLPLTAIVFCIALGANVVTGWTIITGLLSGGTIEKEEDEESKEQLMSSLGSVALLIFIQSIPSITLTAIQESKPKSIFVVDGFGPLVKAPALLPGQNYTGGNGASWSDCFEVRAPSDKWGFLGYWVNSTELVQKLALL